MRILVLGGPAEWGLSRAQEARLLRELTA